jgi:hypothetical protein
LFVRSTLGMTSKVYDLQNSVAMQAAGCAVQHSGQFWYYQASFWTVEHTAEVTQTITLTPAALALFRPHLQGHRTIDVNANRATYQELERAELMAAGNSFAGGQGSIYYVTKEGFERKAEVLACAKAASRAIAPRYVICDNWDVRFVVCIRQAGGGRGPGTSDTHDSRGVSGTADEFDGCLDSVIEAQIVIANNT